MEQQKYADGLAAGQSVPRGKVEWLMRFPKRTKAAEPKSSKGRSGVSQGLTGSHRVLQGSAGFHRVSQTGSHNHLEPRK